MFLKDWHGSGDRFDVTMRAAKDIVAPSDKRAREIFKQVYDSDPEYKSALKESVLNAYASIYKVSASHPSVKQAANEMLKDPFGAGMYAFVKQGRDADILTEAYKKAGYNAIVDYFDKGSLGKQPMILFDAAGDVTKVNERLIKRGGEWIDDALLKEYMSKLRADRSHPMRMYV